MCVGSSLELGGAVLVVVVGMREEKRRKKSNSTQWVKLGRDVE
jgi:hypothetical protein